MEVAKLEKAYKEIIKPSNLVNGMTYDEFLDWVEIGTIDEIECAIKAFEKDDLQEHIKIMKITVKKLKSKMNGVKLDKLGVKITEIKSILN